MSTNNKMKNIDKDKILNCIASNSYYDVDDISEESDLFNDLELDSLDIVDLVMDLEHEFSIGIRDEDWQDADIHNVRDVISFMEVRI